MQNKINKVTKMRDVVAIKDGKLVVGVKLGAEHPSSTGKTTIFLSTQYDCGDYHVQITVRSKGQKKLG